MKKSITLKTAPTSEQSKSENKKKPTTEVKTLAVPKTKSVKKAANSALSIDKACEAALAKLKEMKIDETLQSEINWCLGSYSNDGNPSGLYIMAKRALAIFTVELANGTKGVKSKLISDLEKSIGAN